MHTVRDDSLFNIFQTLKKTEELFQESESEIPRETKFRLFTNRDGVNKLKEREKKLETGSL